MFFFIRLATYGINYLSFNLHVIVTSDESQSQGLKKFFF